ncbi:putative glycolipid-binding domain-containing protein [Pseudonocardia hydrocarbonoxydans]|nr:putative glycolipid-binding domain-containing protein [Pseudonocardia hydrocarbonoxydans]
MLTWQAEDGPGLEGTRLLLGTGGGFRALGRMVRTGPHGAFTASYRLVVADGGTVERLSLTTATAQRERHLTMSRTEDGFWLLDTGSGGTRSEFGGAVDVDLAHSPVFNTIPIRRLGLHTEAAEHTLPTVFVTLPELEVREVEQVYATASVLDADGSACVGFRWDDFTAELTVDADGVVQRYPGVATLLP